jgi:hypothetical protein
MSILFLLLKIILIIVGLIILFVLGFSYALAPNKEMDSVNQIKRFLGFDFNDNYTVIKHFSDNAHPDRPLNVIIHLTEDVIEKVRIYTNGIDADINEIISDDKKNKYVLEVYKDAFSFTKTHEAMDYSPDGNDLLFFRASLFIDFKEMTLSYNECNF